MKNYLILFTLLFVSCTTQYSTKNLIELGDKYPSKNDSDRYYCYAIDGIDSLLLVAEGWNEGIDYSLFKIIEGDSLKLLFRFNPVIVSNDSEDKYHWGYFGDVKSICVEIIDGELFFLTSTNHSIQRDGDIDIPGWQKIIPALMFRGRSTQPNIPVGEIYNKQYMSVNEIISAIK